MNLIYFSNVKGGEIMENAKTEVNWSEVNKEEAELACLGDMCCWKEAD